MADLKKIIQDKNVDLDQLESFITYLASGFSLFSSSFTLIKSAPSQAKIPISEAEKLRVEFSKLIQNKPKSFVRARLPIYFVSLIGFANRRGEGTALATNISKFVSQSTLLEAPNANLERVQEVLECLEALNQPYYLTTLNRKLDPFSGVFGGEKPNSFTKMLAEATQLTSSKLQASLPKPTQEPPPPPPPSDSKPPTVLTKVPPRTIQILPPTSLNEESKDAEDAQQDEPSKEYIPEEINKIEDRILGFKKSTLIWTSFGLLTIFVSYKILKE